MYMALFITRFTIMSSNKDGELWYILAEMLTFTIDASPDRAR